MKDIYKKRILFYIVIFIIVAFVIYSKKIFNSVGIFFFDFSVASIIILILLFFAKHRIFNIWLKFVKFFLPMAVILSFIFPTVNGRIVGFDKKVLIFLLALVFLITSVGIIVIKSLKSSRTLHH